MGRNGSFDIQDIRDFRYLDLNLAIPILFLLVPYGIIQIGLLHQAQQVMFVLGAVVIMAWQIRNRAISLFLTYLCAWILFLFIYAMFRPVPEVVVLGAFDAVLYLGAAAMIFHCVTLSKISDETFFNIICISALAQLLLAYLQYAGFDAFTWILNKAIPTTSILQGHPTGTLGNNNFLAAYLAISFPMFFRRGWWFCIPFIAVMLYLSNTTSAVVPAIIVSIWYFRDKISKREMRIGIAGGLLAVAAYALFQHTPFYSNPRWVDWGIAVKQIFESPWAFIFGRCPGALWGKSYPMHNEWLQIFHSYGLIGFSLFCGIVFSLFAKTKNRILTASLMTAGINMFGNYNLHLAPSAFLITLIAGLKERESL